MVDNWINTKYRTLRQRAESELQGLPQGIHGLSAEDNLKLIEDILERREYLDRLVEELQIHQVELDLQNTELEQTRHNLVVSHERYARLYNHAPVSYLTTTQHGMIIEANLKAAYMLGVEQQALLHMAITSFILPEDQDIYYFHQHRLRETRRTQSCRLRLRRANGMIFHAHLESSCDTDEQNVLSLQTVILDISEQVRAETALQEAHLELEQQIQERTADLTRMLAAQRFLTYVADTLMATTDLNIRLQRVASLIVSQMAQICLVALRTDTCQPELRILRSASLTDEAVLHTWLQRDLARAGDQHPLLMVLRGEQTVYLGEQIHTDTSIGAVLELAAQQNGSIIRLTTIFVPLLADGQITGVLGLFNAAASRIYTPDDLALVEELARRIALAIHNDTLYNEARQARADAEAALVQHERMVHLVSHDLKTPLATIQGYCFMLKRHLAAMNITAPEKLDRDIGKIKIAADLMERHIQDLLDAATLQAGQALALTYAPVNLISMVQRCVEICQTLSQQHTIRVETSETELICIGDDARLVRALINLITNAIKYSPYNSTIRVVIQPEAREDKDGAVINVIDRGVGVPADELVHLFEPFYRGRNAVRLISGHGLGLTGVKKIVEQHGGDIAITSQEGRGSTVSVWLPLGRLDDGR